MGKIHKSFMVVLAIGLLIPACLLAQGDDSGSLRSATVDGYAFLQDQSDHSGVAVIFTAESPSAVTDTFYSNSIGYFTAGLSEGLYSLKYEKEHYATIDIIGDILFTVDTILENVILQGPYIELSGAITGTLDSTYKYLVKADITVPAGDSLIINGGVEIYFSPGLKLDIYGYLKTQATDNDTILFTSIETNPQVGDWEGINIYSANSIINLCIIEYTAGALTLVNSDVTNFQLSNTLIQYFSNYAISGTGTQIEIINNTIDNHYQLMTTAIKGIILAYVSNTLIQDNAIRNLSTNGSCEGLYISGTSSDVSILGNAISNINSNYGSGGSGVGILLYGSNIEVLNNYISDVGYSDSFYTQGIWDRSSNCLIKDNRISNIKGIGVKISTSLVISNRINNCQTGIGWSGSGGQQNKTSGNIITNCNIGLAGVNSFQNTFGGNNFGVVPVTDNVIQSSIFSGNNLSINPPNHSDYAFQSNLIFNDYYELPSYHIPEGLGALVTINSNGDSCDVYYNIFLDPEFADDSLFTLLTTSPCIDAGSANFDFDGDGFAELDPDSTIPDIGAKYYDQGSIVPSADFSSDNISGTFPLVTQFTSQSTGPITAYAWNFGDNATSSIANPVHVYSTEGTYSVSLTVTGPGGVDTEVKTDYITVTTPHYPPEVSYSGSPTTGTTPLTVNFSSSVVNDLDSLRWYFGDGGTSTVANPTYTYQDVGTYSVTLHAYGPYGTDTETKSSYINVIAPNAVAANFSALPLTGIAPMGVQFTNSSAGTIDSVRWTFGDGDSSTAMNPAHEYQSAGIYSISLNVYGPVNNDVMTHENYVTVYDARPMISSVADVPNDQGGQVFLRWDPSGFDGAFGSSINQYSLWQAYGNEWISINNTLAMQSESYTYLASTYNDSTASGIGWSRFKIIAHTSNPATFFTSLVDSGYSVDNIPPEAPGQLLAVASENDVSLEWGVSNESNFMYYKVSRNWEVIAEETSSQYLDSPGSFITPLFYQVASVDDAGNESPGTNEALVDNTNLNWFLNIRADHGGEYNDNDNYLGVADDATNDYDVNYDVLEPPSPPNGYVGLYFPHPEWSHALGDNFTQDIKPAVSLIDSLQEWNFDVIGDQSGIVDLTFYLSENFPEDATTILKNIDTGESFLIADGETVSLTMSPLIVEHFSISIGNNSPNEPVDVSLNSPSTTGFSSLTWVDNSDNEEGYIISKSSDGTTFSYVDSLAANTVSFTGTALTDLAINTQYYFKVTSYNLAATSVGVADSLFTLSNIPSAPIIIDSTLTTIDLSIAENENPSHTEFAIGVTGGAYGTTIHYIQSDGSVLGDTSQVWATKDLWGTLTIMGLAPETEYSISVKSRNGNMVESQFGSSASRSTGNYPTVTLIDPLGPAILQSNSDYSINWLVSNPSFVDSIFLYYSSDSGSTYDLIGSLSDVDSYSWTTPSEYLTYGGKIKVGIKDESGLIRYDESESPFVIVGDSLSSPIETGWALWGVPLTPFLTPIADNLEDDFSGGWWSFAYENDGYIINSDLVGGEGYWLATDAPAVIDVQGQPATAATTLELAQGWKLLTNPLVTGVDRDSLLITKDNSTIPFSEAVSNGWVASEFYHYSTSQGGYEMPAVLEPWKGYWFGVVESGVSVTFPIHSTIDQLRQSTRDILTDVDWRVHLEIQAGSAHDWALIGVDSNATDSFDVGFDVPKPPTTPNPNHVNIGFNHPDWNPVLGESYIVDIRSPLADPSVKEWEVQLSSTIVDSLITVSWTIDNIPEDMVYSFEYGTESINLLEQGSLDFPYSSEVISFILKAEKSPVSAEYAKVIPTDYFLRQNFPNPFNPSTTIRYGLPEDSNVSLVIYDVRGQVVQTLESEHQSAGWYDVTWNGETAEGKQISTGIYLARLVAGEYSQVVKMLYLK